MGTLLIKYFLPEEFFNNFDVEKVAKYPIPGTKRFQLHIHLFEKNMLPEGYQADYFTQTDPPVSLEADPPPVRMQWVNIA